MMMVPTAAPVSHVEVADMNNDGLPDLVVATGTTTTIYFSDGSATPFSADRSAEVGAGGRVVDFFEAADVQGDGWMDVVIGYAGGSIESKLVYYGDDSYSVYVKSEVGGDGQDGDESVVDDVNDAADASGGVADTVGAPLGKETVGTQSVTLVDFNLDGNLDIVYASDGSRARRPRPVGRPAV